MNTAHLAPLRPCRPGCPELTRGGPCERHRAERHQRIDATRGTSTTRGYGPHWRIHRMRVLRHLPATAYRDAQGVIRGHGPLCVMCQVLDQQRTPATDVDHIDGDVTNNVDLNLRPLCHRCHSARTAKDQSFGRRQS
jgi:hypothetical protein